MIEAKDIGGDQQTVGAAVLDEARAQTKSPKSMRRSEVQAI
jgi:hypothetical protein